MAKESAQPTKLKHNKGGRREGAGAKRRYVRFEPEELVVLRWLARAYRSTLDAAAKRLYDIGLKDQRIRAFEKYAAVYRDKYHTPIKEEDVPDWAKSVYRQSTVYRQSRKESGQDEIP